MRFMLIRKADKETEAGALPSEELIAAMGRYNEEMVKAGVMLDGQGLKPTSKGAREFERAASLTRNARERGLLLGRAARSGEQAET